MSSLRPTCNKTDAVLAHCLDGDLDSDDLLEHGYGFACGETLQAHLRECAVCRSALQRARRLDAALATAAGIDVARHPGQVGAGWAQLTDRWLAPATAASAEPVEPPLELTTAPSTLPLQHRGLLLAAAALAVVGAMFGPWALATRAAATPSSHSVATATATTTPAAEAQATSPIPSPQPLRAATSTMAVPTPSANVATFHVASRPSTAATRTKVATPSWRELGVQVASSHATPTERMAAQQTLLAGCRATAPDSPRAFRALVEALAAAGDHDLKSRHLHAAMLQPLRDGELLRQLGASLGALDAAGQRLGCNELAVVVVAARLGEASTDRALRRLARRHPDAVDAIAAALRCDVRSHGGGRLLLDLWDDVQSRRSAPGDERVAMAWFRQQPPSVFTELAAELPTCRSTERRVRCLLALGASDDAAMAAVLRTHMRSSHHAESHAAALALAHLPVRLLADIASQEELDGEYLLRAALARADVAVARPWIAALDLRAGDRHRLRHGTLADFPEVALWFRDRGLLGD